MNQPSDSISGAIALPDAEVAATLRRRWIYLLPAVFLTYSLAYLDRANYGFGAAAGLSATLHITDKDSSMLGGLFFLGYFTFQIPGTILAGKFKVAHVVSTALVLWGMLAALTGIVTEFWLLALDRLLLGVAESIIFPVMLYLLTQWFTRGERSRANSILLLGNPVTVLWMSAITGFLIERFGWQKTFIFEGLPSILWGILWLFLVRDRPSQAGWMSASAAEILEAQLAREQIDIAPVGALRQALLRGDVLLLALQYFCWSLGVYGFVLWLPTIVRRGAEASMTRTGLLSAIPYLVAIPLMLLVSYLSDRTGKRRALIIPFLLLAGIALVGSFSFAERSFTLAFLCLILAGGCMYAPYAAFFAIIPERLPRNVSGEVMAFINSAGALGGFAGTYCVGLLQVITGNAKTAYLLMSLSLICSALLLLFLRDVPAPSPNAPTMR